MSRIVVLVGRRHHGAAARLHLDEPLGLHDAQGLPDRVARDTEVLGEAFLGEPLAGQVLRVHDAPAQLGQHLVAQLRCRSPILVSSKATASPSLGSVVPCEQFVPVTRDCIRRTAAPDRGSLPSTEAT